MSGKTKPKKFVFVLMPFDKAFEDIYAYGIKQTCQELETYCERVDEQIFHERILDRIYNQIAKADLVIADMTGRNANVFYEVGYAHGLNKNVVLLTKNADDIPFDLKHFPHIIYDGHIRTLSEQLKRKIEWFLSEENSEEEVQTEFGLEFLIDGVKIESGRQYYMNPYNVTYDAEALKIDIFNPTSKTYKTKFKIGIEVSKEYHYLFNGLEIIKPNQEKIMFISKDIFNVYPNAYKSFEFGVVLPRSNDGKSIKIPAKLKIFTTQELKEINFDMLVPTKRDNYY